jgi:mannan endo-1,4-beta-mannosidase
MRRCSIFALLSLVIFWLVLLPCRLSYGVDRSPFVTTSGTHFAVDGIPFYVAGVNNHYLPYGSRQEVIDVLDDAVAMHANVIRTFIQPVIGSLDNKVPTIWDWKSTAETSNLGVHGVYMLYWDASHSRMAINDGPNGMRRVDFLLEEARKRGLKVILAFLDFWSYTGGAQQMRAWYGSDDTYTFFAKDSRTIADYKSWMGAVIARVNSLNGKRYADDPTIFAWELMNEPDIHPTPLLRSWLVEMAQFVKTHDRNHLLASGHGNSNGDFYDLQTDGIDFGTWHGYPRFNNITPAEMNERINAFCAMGARYNKPVLLEEFGWSRVHEDQIGVYGNWLNTIYQNQDCSGWIAWRLVSRQDSGKYPDDSVDGFDIRNDDGSLWRLMKTAATRQISKPSFSFSIQDPSTK